MTTTTFEPISVAPFSDALAARTSELLEGTGVLSEAELETLVTRIAARPGSLAPAGRRRSRAASLRAAVRR